ncbi:hypothetical protein FA592_13380 [Sulfurospirillum diekertiae]|uniref:Uncharacterized protein n=1 Tax=Sulfurospirillum diekertiae TaxID=1854492 RepID=A0A6G9VUE5_9BACT|nr:hypothetical protein [Sulfurospirillum diekertiae]QIR77171.1 hypothetical protein FA584_13585 [Sulfurospirillum diekertiae]QIR79785.1 hypothetical protein FA592_13380 [Sulfurospirillum diekertiae]
MPKKKEYRELFQLPPVNLFKKDLLELESILVQNNQTDQLSIEFTYNDTTISASSFNELFLHNDLAKFSSYLSLRMYRRIDHEIEGSISITLHNNFGQCQLSSHDDTWFYGKKHQIFNFFKNKKPWYSFMQHLSIAIIFGINLAVSIIYTINFYTKQQYNSMFLSVLTFLAFIIIFTLILKQKIFPYIKINTYNKEQKKLGINEVGAIFTVITAIITIIQTILQFLPNK